MFGWPASVTITRRITVTSNIINFVVLNYVDNMDLFNQSIQFKVNQSTYASTSFSSKNFIPDRPAIALSTEEASPN